MGKSRPGSSFQVPNAKCLKGLEPNPKSELQTPSSGQWGDCRRKDQMRKETPEKAVLPRAREERGRCLTFALSAPTSVEDPDPIRPPRLLPDPAGVLSLCDLEQATLPFRPGSPVVKHRSWADEAINQAWCLAL